MENVPGNVWKEDVDSAEQLSLSRRASKTDQNVWRDTIRNSFQRSISQLRTVPSHRPRRESRPN